MFVGDRLSYQEGSEHRLLLHCCLIFSEAVSLCNPADLESCLSLLAAGVIGILPPLTEPSLLTFFLAAGPDLHFF